MGCKNCTKFNTCKPPFSVKACSQFDADKTGKIEIARNFLHYVIENLDQCDAGHQLCDAKISEVKWQAYETLKKLG